MWQVAKSTEPFSKASLNLFYKSNIMFCHRRPNNTIVLYDWAHKLFTLEFANWRSTQSVRVLWTSLEWRLNVSVSQVISGHRQLSLHLVTWSAAEPGERLAANGQRCDNDDSTIQTAIFFVDVNAAASCICIKNFPLLKNAGAQSRM